MVDHWAEIEKKEEEKRTRFKNLGVRRQHDRPYWERDHVLKVLDSFHPEEQAAFREFVDDYRKCTAEVHGTAWVSIAVLGKMFEIGWRKKVL